MQSLRHCGQLLRLRGLLMITPDASSRKEYRPGFTISLDLSRCWRDFLDGGQNYKLHILPNIPAKNFWSVVVYDALSRSELQNGHSSI